MSLDDMRQPKPVKFTLEGETEDINGWMLILINNANKRGDDWTQNRHNILTIYPRAIND